MLGQNIGRVGLPDMSAGGRPSLTLDFIGIPVLNERITFSRTSGATWFSPDGVLKGVDFSTSSVAIGTGSKSFTLDATAGVNRYWAVGDLVRVSQQSNSANFMEGTVTSYTVSTQVLVIDVTSTGGSGTIASWRVSSHMPRFDYNPATLAARGLLIEEARTNSIRNNTMQGAVAGTPGTLPNNWSIFTALTGLTRTVVGTGTENGITYIDIRLNGTPSGAGAWFIQPETSTQISASNGQTWTGSAYYKLQAGSTTGITTFSNATSMRDAGGNDLGSISTTFTPTSATLSTQRVSSTITNNNASTAAELQFLRLDLSGVAIDITLRIGLPQLEQGAFATSVIPTTTTALTRSADVASVNTLSPWFNASAGTIYAESQQIAVQTGLTFPRSAQIDDGSNNNLITTLWRADLNRLYGAVTTGGVNQADIGTNGVTQTNANKIALAYATNDFAASTNGAAASTDTSGTVPTGLTILRLGAAFGSATLNGYLRRITYYPRRLSNAELQAITA